MTDEIIDEAIASGDEDARLNADNAELENDTAEQEQQDDINEEDQQDDADSEGGKDKFPKKAVNALNRKDRKINALNAQLRQMEQQMQQFQQLKQQQEKNAPSEPKMDDFDNWEEFQKAQAKFYHEHFQQQSTQEQMQQREQQMIQQRQMLQQQWTEERAAELDTVADEISKTAPEITQLFNQNEHIIQSFPPHVKQMLLQADAQDACHAFYALAKEGKLEQLSQMPPQFIAVEIGRAADRGAAMLKGKSISKAPAPMSQNRGNGRVSKNVESMSADEILNLVR